MNARELFETVLRAWPEAVDISDRRPRQDGYWFPLLASINQGVEDKIDFAHDHWSSIGAWSFYQAVVSYADEMYKAGHRTLSLGSMPLALFDDRVRSNLRAPGCEEEARSYEPM